MHFIETWGFSLLKTKIPTGIVRISHSTDFSFPPALRKHWTNRFLRQSQPQSWAYLHPSVEGVGGGKSFCLPGPEKKEKVKV